MTEKFSTAEGDSDVGKGGIIEETKRISDGPIVSIVPSFTHVRGVKTGLINWEILFIHKPGCWTVCLPSVADLFLLCRWKMCHDLVERRQLFRWREVRRRENEKGSIVREIE